MLLSFLISSLAVAGLIPILITLSKRLELLDQPDERKIHSHYLPRLGGVAIFFAVGLSVGLQIIFGTIELSSFFVLLIIAGGLAFLVGFWDDLQNISARKKLVCQFVVAGVAYLMGFRIEDVLLGITSSVHLGFISPVVTVLWIVTVMNAFNMIDGLDGQAGGFAMIVAFALAILGLIHGDQETIVLSLAIAGACLGFLFYNFHPAKIFMGDSGSMVLGFFFAILTVRVSENGGPMNIFPPMYLLAFPLIDIVTAVIRRMIRQKINAGPVSIFNMIKRTFRADGNHIHHRMLRLKWPQRTIAGVVYVFTFINCILAVLSVYLPFGTTVFFSMFYLWFVVQCIRLLDYEEFSSSSTRENFKSFEEKQKLSTSPTLLRKV